MTRLTILSILLALLFCGCFPTKQLALTDMSTETVTLPFKIDSLSIVDARENLLPMNWDLPVLAVKTRNWSGNPELSAENRTDIERIIFRSQDENGVPANMEFRVLEGICRLHSSYSSVTEYAKFKGEIVLEIPSRNVVFTSQAEMYYDHPSLNATEEGTMRLYNQALKNVTHVALKQIEEDARLN